MGGELLLCNHAGCGAHQTSNATLSGTLRNRGSTSRPSVTRAALVGISDSGPPLLERFEVSDPDQLDYFFTDDDIVTAVFDRATDLGANEARRGRVDALLAFNIPPGADYSGQWLDDSTFVVTVTELLS